MCHVYASRTNLFFAKIKKSNMDTSGGPISWSAFKQEFCEKYYPTLVQFRNRDNVFGVEAR